MLAHEWLERKWPVRRSVAEKGGLTNGGQGHHLQRASHKGPHTISNLQQDRITKQVILYGNEIGA